MGELIANLGIDWRLLIAQAVNFFILLFVLRKFLYRPLLALLDKRASVIAENQHKEEELNESVSKMEEERARIVAAAELEAQKIIEEAYKKATEVSETVVAKAHKEARDLVEATEKKLEERKETFDKALVRDAGELISLSLEKVLPDILDEKTQEKVIANSLQDLSRDRA